MTNSKSICEADYDYAQLLLSGEAAAWKRFYNEFRIKLEAYINRKYPNVFSEIAIEEIFDGVGKRLIENNYKTLRDYRGECSFSTYITKATEWEISDWLRKHLEELLHDPIDTVGGDGKIIKDSASTFKQLKKFGDTLVLHPLNSRYEDIELKKGVKYRIVGKVVKKEKRY